jgi:hypothetical protein
MREMIWKREWIVEDGKQEYLFLRTGAGFFRILQRWENGKETLCDVMGGLIQMGVLCASVVEGVGVEF